MLLLKEVLKKIIVKEDDFKKALKEIQPSALREVLIQIPNIKWEDMHKIVCSENGIMYSSHRYKSGHRKKENAISGFNLLIFDFDEDTTIDEVSNYFKDYDFLIATTRSHLKEKNGKICERFRLILRLNKTLFLNSSQYEAFMRNALSSLPFKADLSCIDISRMFFSSN